MWGEWSVEVRLRGGLRRRLRLGFWEGRLLLFGWILGLRKVGDWIGSYLVLRAFTFSTYLRRVNLDL